MTRALADRISARRASDRLAALNPFIQPDAGASVAPVETSSTDEPLIPEGSAGAANSDGPTFMDLVEAYAGVINSRGGVESRHAFDPEAGTGASDLARQDPAIAGVAPGPREAFDLGDIPSFLDRRHKQ